MPTSNILLQLQNNPAEAVYHYQQARSIQERTIAVRGLNTGLASELGWSCQNGASALLRTKPDAKLVSVAVRAVEMREYLVAQTPSDAAQAALLSTLSILGQAVSWVSDADGADLEKAASVAEARTQTSLGPGIAWRILGIVRYRQGKYAEAVKALQSSVAAKLDDPAIDQLFLAMALTRTNQVDVYVVLRWEMVDDAAGYNLYRTSPMARTVGASQSMASSRSPRPAPPTSVCHYRIEPTQAVELSLSYKGIQLTQFRLGG